jgi:hypothetical protein
MHLHDLNDKSMRKRGSRSVERDSGGSYATSTRKLASFLGPAKPGRPPKAPFFQWQASLKSLPCLFDRATKPPSAVQGREGAYGFPCE